LRIWATDKIEHNGKLLAAKVLFAHLAIGESQSVQGSCLVWGYPVSVEALRLPDNSLLIVIRTSRFSRSYSGLCPALGH